MIKFRVRHMTGWRRGKPPDRYRECPKCGKQYPYRYKHSKYCCKTYCPVQTSPGPRWLEEYEKEGRVAPSVV